MQDYMCILRNRNFLLLWLGQGVSAIGSRIHYIALIWLVTELTGNAAGVGLLLMFMAVPRIVVFPVAGVLVERWNKKNVIVACDVLSGVTAVGIALTENIAAIYVLSTVSIMISLFFMPAIQAAVPRIVPKEQLMTANSLTSMTRQAASLGGPAIGGIIIAIWGVKLAFIINGVSFLLSAFSEVFIDMPHAVHEQQAQHQPGRFLRELTEGWEYIRTHTIVKLMIVYFALASIPLGAILVLKVVLLKDALGLTVDQYGLIMTIEGLGLFLGAIVAGKCGSRWHELTTMIMSCALVGAAYVGLSLVHSFWPAALFIAAVGMSGAITNVAYGTFLQRNVDDHVRSRVFSFDIAISEIFALASMGAAGFLGDTFGIAPTILVGGACVVFMSMYMLRLPAYGEIQRARAASAN